MAANRSVRPLLKWVCVLAFLPLTALSALAQVQSTAGAEEQGLFNEDVVPGAICGANDWRDAKCYESSRPVEYGNSRAVVHVLIDGTDLCTAFKVSDSGQFLMSGLCRRMRSFFNVQDLVVLLDDQATGCDSGVVTYAGVVRGAHELIYDPDLDFYLFDTVGDSSAIPCLQLDQRMPDEGEPIYIAHQPRQDGTKLSLESDQDEGGVCRVLQAPIDAYTFDDDRRELDFSHTCDTWTGSLGAPVISNRTQRVVGIQHIGYCNGPPYPVGYNTASRMDLIYPRIASVVGVCSNGTACAPDHGKCDCDGICKRRERNYVRRGHVCPDCP